ncbi:MAG: hypothetical protein RMJ55_02695, partial [Roseiflexaceae bacterium]|nr:hypothetical protein [Roseiflexaceae bacterium]
PSPTRRSADLTTFFARLSLSTGAPLARPDLANPPTISHPMLGTPWRAPTVLPSRTPRRAPTSPPHRPPDTLRRARQRRAPTVFASRTPPAPRPRHPTDHRTLCAGRA